MIIIDTNVISELTRPAPDERVRDWFRRTPAQELFTTSVTEAEILYGVFRMPEGRRRNSLLADAVAIFSDDFGGRVLAFDSPAARAYAQITVERRRAGRPSAALDVQIAAIAQSRGAAVATRNAGDFEYCGVTVINPWTGEETA